MTDLSLPLSYQAQTTFASWPKCYRCTQRLGEPYPVELFGIAGREEGSLVGGKYKLIIEVRCKGQALMEYISDYNLRITPKELLQFRRDHGECEQRIVLEAMRAWTPVAEQMAVARVFAFAPGGKPGHHGVHYRPGTNRAKHRLETEVR